MEGVRSVPTAIDLLNLLDAVYDVEQSRSRWFTGVLEAFLTTFGPGAGVGGVLYDISASDRIAVELMKGVHIPPGWREAGLDIHADTRFIPAIVANYRSTLCASLADLLAAASQDMHTEYYSRHGIRGQIMVNGADCSGKGGVIFLFSSSPITLSDAQRDLFSRLATHIATAYRLQRGRPHDPEAILTPGGHVEHAEPAARAAATRQHLGLAVRQREQIRSAQTDARRVIRGLKGLVDGTWTLVDQYERGGKRYVLARENAPKPREPARLSERERQVAALAALGRTNKLIAYELGLAQPTVRVLMARACAKLGVKTRMELIATERGRRRS